MRIYSGRPQDTDNNRIDSARTGSDDFFAVPLPAKEAEMQFVAAAAPGSRHSAIIAAARPQ
jgi:hypothetical protein